MPSVMARAQFDPAERQCHTELMAAATKVAAAFLEEP
jgi:hypothetical protein